MKKLKKCIFVKNPKFSDFSFKELVKLFSSIKLVAKIIHLHISKIRFEKSVNFKKKKNIQDEIQTKLDLFANEQLKSILEKEAQIAGIVSEEEDEIIVFNGSENKKYIVLIDPLDGSSNIDVNVSVGTIFSIYQRTTPIGTTLSKEDFLQPGNKQIAAGYIMYSFSTILVYSIGIGVHAFTYDPSSEKFVLSHKNIRFPSMGEIYSINEGNYMDFPIGVKKYIQYCKEKNKFSKTSYTSRYVGSLVSDFHRNLLQGGIYLYPSTSNYPTGKLRLLYECNPLSFLAEQAGGKSSNGKISILNIFPKKLHQRSEFYIGTKSMVNKVEYFIKNYKK